MMFFVGLVVGYLLAALSLVFLVGWASDGLGVFAPVRDRFPLAGVAPDGVNPTRPAGLQQPMYHYKETVVREPDRQPETIRATRHVDAAGRGYIKLGKGAKPAAAENPEAPIAELTGQLYHAHQHNLYLLRLAHELETANKHLHARLVQYRPN